KRQSAFRHQRKCRFAWKADICNVAVSPTATSFAVISSLYSHRSTALEENNMTATYTFDVFSSLDGYGAASANWTGYWGKQGPELLDHRLALYGAEQRMVFGANTYRAFARMLASSTEESEVRDPLGHADEEPAGNGGVDDAGRPPRLARRDPRER